MQYLINNNPVNLNHRHFTCFQFRSQRCGAVVQICLSFVSQPHTAVLPTLYPPPPASGLRRTVSDECTCTCGISPATWTILRLASKKIRLSRGCSPSQISQSADPTIKLPSSARNKTVQKVDTSWASSSFCNDRSNKNCLWGYK
ncbi:hypothetical protein RRG08_002772 [Elysia crispata]|uniref:Uncharacterized protein n=1 Tax=Elysia crispata TaxID=231223 RepID=A0AAE0XTW8_9GAST|nr:hypothetical protein RRG08_002772 [Elysia crispata]